MIFLYASPTIAHNAIIGNPISDSFVSNNPLANRFADRDLEERPVEATVHLDHVFNNWIGQGNIAAADHSVPARQGRGCSSSADRTMVLLSGAPRGSGGSSLCSSC